VASQEKAAELESPGAIQGSQQPFGKALSATKSGNLNLAAAQVWRKAASQVLDSPTLVRRASSVKEPQSEDGAFDLPALSGTVGGRNPAQILATAAALELPSLPARAVSRQDHIDRRTRDWDQEVKMSDDVDIHGEANSWMARQPEAGQNMCAASDMRKCFNPNSSDAFGRRKSSPAYFRMTSNQDKDKMSRTMSSSGGFTAVREMMTRTESGGPLIGSAAWLSQEIVMRTASTPTLGVMRTMSTPTMNRAGTVAWPPKGLNNAALPGTVLRLDSSGALVVRERRSSMHGNLLDAGNASPRTMLGLGGAFGPMLSQKKQRSGSLPQACPKSAGPEPKLLLQGKPCEDVSAHTSVGRLPA